MKIIFLNQISKVFIFLLERRLLGLLGGVSQESDKVIQKSNGKQTGPYLVSHVSIIFINFFLIKKGWQQLKYKK